MDKLKKVVTFTSSALSFISFKFHFGDELNKIQPIEIICKSSIQSNDPKPQLSDFDDVYEYLLAQGIITDGETDKDNHKDV